MLKGSKRLVSSSFLFFFPGQRELLRTYTCHVGEEILLVLPREEVLSSNHPCYLIRVTFKNDNT
jgi:hypothetical protein